MLIPSSENDLSFLGTPNPVNSFDDYLVEKLLDLEDQTPFQEDDDAERVLQIVQIEDFTFQKAEPEKISFVHAITAFPPFVNNQLPSIYHDIIVQPPNFSHC